MLFYPIMLVNEIIINKIKNLLDFANKTNSKTKYIYKKIYDDLKNKQTSIVSKTQIKNLTNVGPKIFQMLISHIESVLIDTIDDLETLEKYKLLLDDSSYNNIKNRLRLNRISISTIITENDSDIDDVVQKNVNCLNGDVNPCKNLRQNDYNEENNLMVKNCNFEISTEKNKNKKNSEKFLENNNTIENENINVTEKNTKIEKNKNNIVENNLCQNENFNITPIKKKVKSIRKYVPAYKSAAYGLLKALWLEDGITKHRIIYLAKNYSTTDFDITTKFSGWTSMKALIKNSLVYKETDTKKYFLTLEGQLLSNKLFQNTSIVKVEDNVIILLIDSREMKNRNHRSFFQKYFELKNVKYETRLLEVGDFTWIKNDKILDYIVERKCGSDFVSSIIDGRLKEQKSRLIKTGISNIFYIIENLKQRDFKNINSDYGSFCLTSLKLNGFIVIETENINETGDVLLNIDSIIKKQTECADIMTFGSFIEKSKKNYNMNVKDFLFYAFLSVRGINYEKAKKLTEYFKTLKNFMNFVKDGSLLRQLQNEEFGLSNKNIEKIINLMCK